VSVTDTTVEYQVAGNSATATAHYSDGSSSVVTPTWTSSDSSLLYVAANGAYHSVGWAGTGNLTYPDAATLTATFAGVSGTSPSITVYSCGNPSWSFSGSGTAESSDQLAEAHSFRLTFYYNDVCERTYTTTASWLTVTDLPDAQSDMGQASGVNYDEIDVVQINFTENTTGSRRQAQVKVAFPDRATPISATVGMNQSGDPDACPSGADPSREPWASSAACSN